MVLVRLVKKGEIITALVKSKNGFSSRVFSGVTIKDTLEKIQDFLRGTK